MISTLAETGVLHPPLEEFPAPWAFAWGEDRQGPGGRGYWQAFEVEGVELRLRWIPPTTFRMGSPVDEEGREDNESQHAVRLNRGFWLGETTCTQALWQAVMKGNSTKLEGNIILPVNNVSWDDIQEFLTSLNKIHPGLEFCLPTEAQWEYACRAGVAMPFNVGGTLSSHQANFDGTFPYGKSKKGPNRREAVPVKTFPPNAWGLYEMHGNVSEWCRDWSGHYTWDGEGPIEDPEGAETGDRRILRGGSWLSDGRACRSSARLGSAPGSRENFIGFRLARRLPNTAGRQAAMELEPAGPPIGAPGETYGQAEGTDRSPQVTVPELPAEVADELEAQQKEYVRIEFDQKRTLIENEKDYLRAMVQQATEAQLPNQIAHGVPEGDEGDGTIASVGTCEWKLDLFSVEDPMDDQWDLPIEIHVDNLECEVYIHKSDWYSMDSPRDKGYELVDPDHNNHYVSATYEAPATFNATLRFDFARTEDGILILESAFLVDPTDIKLISRDEREG